LASIYLAPETVHSTLAMACHLACRSIVLIDIYRVKELAPLDKPKEEALVYAYATA